ncbi:MAG: tetratricopeptide repeat protein, partial [Pirellulales bacterium]|nr:tetratricopeptide repeat protein [Pirellulales bacterium]
MIKVIQMELLQDSDDVRADIEAWQQRFDGGVWEVLKPIGFESFRGATHRILEDQSILVTGTHGDTDVYHVELDCSLPKVAAIRIEAIPDPSLPKLGSGRGARGDFVLTEVQANISPRRPATPRVRYLRVEQEYGRVELHEVQVFSRGLDIAPRAEAEQSQTSAHPNRESTLAIDGDKTTCSTTVFDEGTWWEADLGSEFPIDEIRLWFHPFNRARRDLCDRLKVVALDESRNPVWHDRVQDTDTASATFRLTSSHPLHLGRGSETASLFVPGEANPYRRWKAFGAADQDVRGSTWGWNPGPACQARQSASFEVLEVSSDPENTGVLALNLLQNHGQGMLLGRFRISASTKPIPALSPDVEQALQVAAPLRSPADWQALALHHDKNSRVSRGIDPQCSTTVEPTTDFPSDYAWMRTRLNIRIRECCAAGDFNAAMKWAQRRLELERTNHSPVSELLAAAVLIAQLAEATGSIAEEKQRLAAIRDQANDEASSLQSQWHLSVLTSILQDWERVEAKAAQDELLHGATRTYLTVSALTWLARRPGKVSDAKQVLADYIKLFGPTNVRVGFAYYELAQCERKLLKSPRGRLKGYGQYIAGFEQAAEHFQSAISIFDRQQASSLSHAQALEGMGECVAMLGKYDRMAEVQQRAMNIYEQIVGRDTIVFANAATLFAEYAINNPKYLHEVGDIALHAAKLVEGSSGYLTFVRARALAQAGMSKLHSQQHAQSIVALEESRELYQQMRKMRPGLTLPAHLLLTLGQSYYSLGRYSEARREWEQARESLAPNGRSTARMPRERKVALTSCLTSLGGFYLDIGALSIAQPLLERSVSVARSMEQAPNHAPEALQTLAELKGREGQWEEAERLLDEALQLCDELFEKESPPYTLCLAQLGFVQAKRGKLD